jgi:hypothetical protein
MPVPSVLLSVGLRIAAAPATPGHNDQFGTQPKRSSDAGAVDHIGGSARGYQAIFVPLAALTSPDYSPMDSQPAVYLYIAALEANARNCREWGAVGHLRRIWIPG